MKSKKDKRPVASISKDLLNTIKDLTPEQASVLNKTIPGLDLSLKTLIDFENNLIRNLEKVYLTVWDWYRNS